MSGPAAVQLEGHMRDARGRLVPITLIKPEQLFEDELVRKLHAKADELSELLRRFREEAFEEIDVFLETIALKYNVKLGGQRGNLTLSAFDGEQIVQVAIGDKIDLGPDLEAAKVLIDDCIARWSENADVNLQALVANAFDVDKKGKINVTSILALRRAKIDDSAWKEAMEAISEAVRVVCSKRYLRLYRKPQGKPKTQVALDLASA